LPEREAIIKASIFNKLVTARTGNGWLDNHYITFSNVTRARRGLFEDWDHIFREDQLVSYIHKRDVVGTSRKRNGKLPMI
jgi:hypothetical protein